MAHLFLRYRFCWLLALAMLGCVCAYSQKTDSIRAAKDSLHVDSLHYPLKDRRGDRFSYRNTNPFYLSDSSFIRQDIQYDPVTKQYYIIEKIGNSYYRKPTYLTYDEFWQLQNQQAEEAYFQERSQTLSYLNRKATRPPMQVYHSLFDRIFGLDSAGLKVSVKPQGNVDLRLGYQGQNIKNPTLSENARRNGGFDFDMDANVNVNANIGNKLKLPISYNTLANFDFQNQLKLDYKGKDDEILKSIEAGNMSFQTKGTLMSSVQSLFGIKTGLQFGKLHVTAAIATERSQRQSITLQGGGLAQQINKKLDDYDENRNFLLAQYFRTHYDRTMANLPVVNSQVQILRMEVWVTNRTGTTTQARTVVGLMDLGENAPYNPNVHSLITGTSSRDSLPQNGANDLYASIAGDSVYRQPTLVNTFLTSKGLQPVQDFEKTFARQLLPTEYFYNPQAGFISLYQQLQPDEVLAVAYQYSYNGRVYQVGEFAQDVAVDSSKGIQKVLFLKLLKSTSQRVNLPLWGLMMKNVYSLDVTGLNQQDFRLNVYYQEPSGGIKRYLPESSPTVSGKPLLSILNLDRLNNRNDPQPDGNYDFVDSFTVLSQQGKIIFPVLEPFGRYLQQAAFFDQPVDVQQKYLYYQLYDSIKAIAQTYANLDRYLLQGTVKGTSNTDIYLGGFNIPQGSVVVTAGGQTLLENTDYIVDYNLGTLKIINQAIINSGVPVNVSFENNATYGTQQRSFTGIRADYLVNNKLSLGATMERISERPYFTKMNYGEDPINNAMYGVDFNYRSELPGLTRLLDRLPFYTTTARSSINAYGEAALLKPGHAAQIGKGGNGLIYIDDFEGSTSNVDLRYPLVSWVMASTPAGNHLFPEADSSNSLAYGKNRARLAWYNIEPVLQDKNSPSNPLRHDLNALSDPRVRLVYTNELFPQRTTNITDVQSTTFDLAYYPTDPGQYNYEASPTEISANGKLLNPQKRWGGIMRSIDQTDFVTGNVQFIEFWMQDPFIKNPASTGGKLFINLGDVSEDVLKDGRRFYENGLNSPTQPASVDNTSVWGKTPLNPVQVTNAFSNDPQDRPYQDVGFDGLTDDSERIVRSAYLAQIATNFGAASPFYQRANQDPSYDNYVWYRDSRYDAGSVGILGRYKFYNNQQGNSPVASASSQYSSAATLYPDNEDLNRDNTLNETEEYYEYEIDMKPGMDVGLTKYITDKRIITPKLANGTTSPENWYLFRVPVDQFTEKIGNIPDFKSIRFIRMYLTGFQDSVVMRFASFNLVRNQWRNFTYELDTTGSYTQLPANNNATFDVLAVNLEENSARTPIPYKIPPGIERVQSLSNNGINLLQNEQSMSLRVRNLPAGESRAVFKTLNLDLRQYGRLSMFVHAESLGIDNLQDGQVNAVIRIGQDFLNNYYEIKIPLQITRFGITDPNKIWPDSNNLDFELSQLTNLKLHRNANASASLGTIYRERVGNRTYSILGNPNLGEVSGFLIAVENPKTNGNTAVVNTEVWVDELRLSELNEKGGGAALARVDMQLADLGTLSVSANTYTAGWGGLEQRVNERAKNSMLQYDAALNIDAGKLFPKKLGFNIPMYASINKTILIPEYDPYDLDIKYKYKLGITKNKDSLRSSALDQTTIKTLNFTNVRLATPTLRPKLWSLSNFDFSYSITQTLQTTPIVTENKITRQRGGFGYTYNSQAHYKEPFKRLIKNKSAWLAFARDFNFNLNPSLLSFRADINRQFGEYVPRIVNVGDTKIERVDTTYDKYFTFDRYYNARWDLTRSVNFDFNATNFARVDEPYGRLDTKDKRDSVLHNFLKGGRNTLYQQRATIGYTLPLSKLPFADWITARYNYATNYNWIGASLLAVNLGNTLENGQQNSLNGEFDFTRLYAKSKLLNSFNLPTSPKAPKRPTINQNAAQKSLDSSQRTRADVVKDLKGKQKRQALQTWRRQKRDARKAARQGALNEPMEVAGFEKAAGRLLTMVKRASVNYSETYSSRVPGYTDTSHILGNNFKTMQPGLDYVFGRQPDSNWLNKKAAQGVITKDSTFNLLYRQTFDQRMSITAQLEPVSEFIVDVNIEKTFSKDFTELFKDTTGTGSHFGHLSPYASGGFNVSYISFQTLFANHNPSEISKTFVQFEGYRSTISRRLASTNKYYSGGVTPDGFADGYGRNSQDVLIPAFIAAYTGKSPNSVALINQNNSTIKTNPFGSIKPLPNWHVTYTGLSKIPALASIFTNISITHGYNGQLSMNSFNSALNFYDPLHYGTPGFTDPTSGNFVPFFLIPNLTISEQFNPLIGFDVTTINQTNINFQYKRSRQLSLSLVDYQLSEVNSREIVFGASIRKKNVNPPFKIPGFKKLNAQKNGTGNDLNIRLDFSIRDDAQSNSRLDFATAYSTGGQKVVSIQPSIDYVLNNRINLQLYFDQQRTIPYISTSAPITTTRAGLQIRISLAQ